MLYRTKGQTGKCGPSAISAIVGIQTQEAAGISFQARGLL